MGARVVVLRGNAIPAAGLVRRLDELKLILFLGRRLINDILLLKTPGSFFPKATSYLKAKDRK